MMSADDLPWTPGTFVNTRLLPVGDLFILSGIQTYGASREELEGDELVVCDNPSCRVMVHQKCYGVQRKPGSAVWLCDACSIGVTPP